jgi:hypothetical protein
MAIIRTSNGYTHKVSDIDLAVAMKEEEAWAKKLRQALVDKAYDENTHRELAKEMEAIEARLGNYTGGTIFDHVRSIFDDAVTRGFQHDLHFPQLLIQYKRYGFGEPPEQWVPPPDVQSRDTSPVLFPAVTQTSPHPTRLAPPGESNHLPSPIDAYRPATKDRKTLSNRNNPPPSSLQEPESSTSATKAKANSKEPKIARITPDVRVITVQRPGNVPADAIRYLPGCSRCRTSQRSCWVRHKSTSKPACYGCRYGRTSCDITETFISGDHNTPEAPLAESKLEPRPRPSPGIGRVEDEEYASE